MVENWREYGVCWDHPTPEIWFPPQTTGRPGSTSRIYGPAMRLCGDCPVQPQCEAYAIETRPKFGLWAGHSPTRIATLAGVRR